MTRQEQIDELQDNIARGKAFEAQGYDCGMMIAMSQVLLDKLLAKEAEDADTLTAKADEVHKAVADLGRAVVKESRVSKLMDWIVKRFRR